MNTDTTRTRLRSALTTAFVALLAGVAGVTGSYAIAGFTPAFVVAPIATFTSQTMPGAVVTFAITTFGELGDLLNLVTAIGLAVGLLAATTLTALIVGRALDIGRRDASMLAVWLAAALGWLAAFLVTMAPVPALGAGVGTGAVVAAGELAAGTRADDGAGVSSGRRGVLGSVAGTLGLGVLGYLLGNRRDTSTAAAPIGSDGADGGAGEPLGADGDGAATAGGASGDAGTAGDAGADEAGTAGDETDGRSTEGDAGGEPTTEGPPPTDGAGDGSGAQGGQLSIEELLALAEERSLGIEGLEGLVSGEDFYEVDIYNVDPELAADDWTLSVTGAVEEEVEFTYDDLRGMEPENRFESLRCVGEGLNGKKMDNALWTGVPIPAVIEQANPQGEYVVLRDGDGYFEEFSAAALETGLLAYGKDGSTLPRGHGFPVRALIPGHWGEINVKWIEEIEISTEEVTGYWEERGWHGTGPVNTVAKLHATGRLDDGRLQVGGHAYAGTRGVRKVEVSTDGGDSWNDATLSERLPEAYGTDVWRQWAYDYQPPDGEHTVVVRATDGTGTLQPKEESGAFPNGPSGWVSKSIDPSGIS
jgi:DMSO/TMAO reductase YedYZ molybdopterin-dependent catalytic subunit